LLTRSRRRAFANYTVTKIAETSRARAVAISPDGKYLAATRRDNKGLESLWLRHLPTNSNAQVVPAIEGALYSRVVFSSDGNYIYFRRGGIGAEERKTYDFYRVAVLGGTPSLLVRDTDSDPTFSPDGQRIAFLRDNNPEMGKYRILIANHDGGDERTLVTGVNPYPYQPTWAPDGKVIVCIGEAKDKNTTELLAIDVETGKQRAFARLKVFREFLDKLTWLRDGSGLLMINNEMQSGRIGFVSYPRGEYQTMVTDSGLYQDISLTSDDRTMAAVVAKDNYYLYLVPASGAGAEARQLISLQGGSDASWTRDGKVLTDPDAGIVLLDPSTGDRTTILSDEKHPSLIPTMCPDDRTIVFISIVPNTPSVNLWKIDRSGQGMQQLTYGNEDIFLVCSADNKWVYYRDGAAQAIMKVPLAGGSPTKIASGFFSQIGPSPDGKLLAFLNAPESKGGKYHFQIVLFATDGSPPKAIDADPRFGLEDRPWAGFLRFTPDGKEFAYGIFENSVGNIWVQPLDGSAPRALTNFTAEEIRDFNWSPDGNELAVVRGHTESEVFLLHVGQQ
jgi:Tol biopolymer transport system component